MSQRPRLFLGFRGTLLFVFMRLKRDHCNVHLRHISVALTGRRWCVRAGCISRSGRISPSDLQHLSLEYLLVLSVAAPFDLCSKRATVAETTFENLHISRIWPLVICG